MARPIVIIHGWSDDSKSFRKLSGEIQARLQIAPTLIQLADWISLQDDVTYADLAQAMDRAWSAKNLPRTPRSVDVVIHSTGALVVRDWMTRNFTPETVPIFHFLMLAPANFGSNLAHKGRSFLGRALKGWNRFLGQTGTQVLKGLELASPYTVELAERDLFNSGAVWYGQGRILATVLVGNEGYSGVESIANEDGGDGTVRISTANLNANLLTMTLDDRQQAKPGWQLRSSLGQIAFGIVDKENHSSIALKSSSNDSEKLMRLIVGALTVADPDYASADGSFAWQRQIDQIDLTVKERSPRYQNLVTHVQDNFLQDVSDYFIQFYRKLKSDAKFEKQLYETVIKDVHPYQDNKAYRSIYLSIDALEELVHGSGFSVQSLYLSLSASPVFKPPRQPVGYLFIGANESDGLAIPAEDIGRFFMAHRTLIVKIVIERKVDESVFRIP